MVVMAQLSDWWVALNLRCEERAPEDNNKVENKYIHREIHSFETVKTLAIKIRNPFSFPVLATRSLSTSSTPFHLSTPPPPTYSLSVMSMKVVLNFLAGTLRAKRMSSSR